MSERNLVDGARHSLNSALAVRWLMSDTRLLRHDCLAARFSRV